MLANLEQPVQQPRQDSVGIEVFGGHFPGGAAMALIVSLHFRDRGRSVVD